MPGWNLRIRSQCHAGYCCCPCADRGSHRRQNRYRGARTCVRLLHPHLSDLVRFMDYGERPTGGAGPSVNTVRSFAAAGIANRVVALFDNDTAATDALRSLGRARLPDNIRVRQYPPLDLARHYPTLGPPPADSGVAYTNVNGLAGSVEMYLGRDILTLQDGTLRPVQWHTYIPGARQYQGEITGKQALHEAYRAKLRAAEIDPSNIAKQDWSGIHAIFDVVFQAFRSDTVTDQQPRCPAREPAASYSRLTDCQPRKCQ